MSLYSGTKSLDAEIKINFLDNTVTMDYSKNDGNYANSNTSIVYDSEWDNLPDLYKALYSIFIGVSNLIVVPFIVLFYVVPLSYLQTRGYVTSESIHYRHQKIMKWLFLHSGTRSGTTKTVVTVTSKRQVVYVGLNVWMHYDLSESAQKHIESIELVRHFNTFYRYGRYKETRQHGWDAIFTFSEVPIDGTIIIQSLLQ